MEFTPQEIKMIERMRKQERSSPRTRWIFLISGISLFAAYGYIAHLLLSTLGSETFSPDVSTLLIAIFWPKVILMAGVAGLFIGLAIRDWHGNANRMLLLRLLDAHQKGTSNENVNH